MRVVILLFVLLIATAGLSQETYTPQHDYKILRVIDGDTVEIEANYLPEPIKPVIKLRIYGIDTPEKGQRAKCPKENMRSLKAKLYVEQEISNAKVKKIWIKGWDKYGGRILGDVILDGQLLSERLVKNGYAIYYDGGAKNFNWCAN